MENKKVSRGLFGVSDEADQYQSLDQRFVKNKFSTFFFEAEGDSMTPTIYSGQILIVDRSLTEFHGRVCVMNFEDKMICKRIFQTPNGLILRSDNSQYKDILVSESERISLWGVVTAVAGFIK